VAGHDRRRRGGGVRGLLIGRIGLGECRVFEPIEKQLVVLAVALYAFFLKSVRF